MPQVECSPKHATFADGHRAWRWDSLIELASAGTILWLYAGARRDSDASERRAQQIIAGCFAVLALYLAFDAIGALADGLF